MAKDPFAGMDENATQETPAAEPETKKKTTTAKKETKNVAVDNEGKIVVTLKGGKGYEAPWIVIHANTIEEANAHLNDEKLAGLIKQTQKVAEFF
ncbi:hypothetical protein QP281_24700, partial [Escherichia coli]|nr:hypothetical protein [Escherichia coli]